MRDRRFIAEHRGGPLKKEQHQQLSKWASGCAEHVLHLFGREIDERLQKALRTAEEWRKGTASVGDARKASLDATAVARESSDPAAIAVARSVGHAVATAHMADHSMGAAWYAMKAVKASGKPADVEARWQVEKLPLQIRKLILTAMQRKGILRRT